MKNEFLTIAMIAMTWAFIFGLGRISPQLGAQIAAVQILLSAAVAFATPFSFAGPSRIPTVPIYLFLFAGFSAVCCVLVFATIASRVSLMILVSGYVALSLASIGYPLIRQKTSFEAASYMRINLSKLFVIAFVFVALLLRSTDWIQESWAKILMFILFALNCGLIALLVRYLWRNGVAQLLFGGVVGFVCSRFALVVLAERNQNMMSLAVYYAFVGVTVPWLLAPRRRSKMLFALIFCSLACVVSPAITGFVTDSQLKPNFAPLLGFAYLFESLTTSKAIRLVRELSLRGAFICLTAYLALYFIQCAVFLFLDVRFGIFRDFSGYFLFLGSIPWLLIFAKDWYVRGKSVEC